MAENRACDRCDRKTHIGRIARARERRNPCKVSHLPRWRNPAILENRDRGAKAVTGHQIRLPGFRVDKKGRLIRDAKRLDVSRQLQRRRSKRVRVANGVVSCPK